MVTINEMFLQCQEKVNYILWMKGEKCSKKED